MVVDVHLHVIVPELLRTAAAPAGWRPRVWRADGAQCVELGGQTIRSAVDEFVDIDAILDDRRARGIGGVLACPWVPLLYPGSDAATALTRCRLQNAGLAALRDGRADRVTLLGAVPLQDPELAAVELEALMAGGEFAGVEVTASVGGEYLGAERFEPFWAAAERSGALVFIHPTTRGFDAPVFGERYLWNLVGNPMETTLCAAHLLLTGTFEHHPGLRVMLAHGGGAIVALGGRIRHGRETVAAAGPPPPPDAAPLRHFLYDTVTHDPHALRALVEAVGADRVLLGSDYPFDMADHDPLATLAAAGLTAAEQAAILETNAARELRPPGGS